MKHFIKISWRPGHRAVYIGPANFFIDFGTRPHDDNRRGWSFFLDHHRKDSCLR